MHYALWELVMKAGADTGQVVCAQEAHMHVVDLG
jgi:hypothetical protein